MSFRKQRVIFMTPFYMLFEFFLLKYIFLLIYPLNDTILFILTLIIGFLNVMPMFAEEKKSRFLTRTLTEISALWMWASLMYLIDIIIIYLFGFFVHLDFMIICLMLAIVPLIGIYAYFKAHRLVVNEENLYIDKLTADINIVHLSDVHFGAVRYKRIINQLKDKLNELSDTCDLAIISGDLADGSSLVCEDDFLPLKEVKMPIIFTPGNHDYYPGIDNVIKACKKANIIVLDNNLFEIGDLNIYGLSYSFDNGTLNFNDLKNKINPSKVNIVNYHVPYFWKELSGVGFDIQLSGHTHGGQFYPMTWFSELIFKYNKGLFKEESGHYLHVTTGVGSMDQPIRWGTDSEVVILKLKRKMN